MARKKIIAGNWKMNMTPSESAELINLLKNDINTNDVDVVICPPFTSLGLASDLISNTDIFLGAQNMHFEDKGAFTGEVSPNMIKELGCKYVIIGHSERREYFAETDETVNKKILKALEVGLTPIICVGESLTQRENDEQYDFVKSQLINGLKDISLDDASKLVIAYEPIWAIGTGKTATSIQAQEMCKFIRETLSEIFNSEIGDKIRIQYGGSVNSSNAKELFGMDDIDGGLIGGASLKDEFIKIVKYNN